MSAVMNLGYLHNKLHMRFSMYHGLKQKLSKVNYIDVHPHGISAPYAKTSQIHFTK